MLWAPVRTRYSVWTPDAPAMLALTVVHFCQPPVTGTVTAPTSGPVALSRCSSMLPPLRDLAEVPEGVEIERVRDGSGGVPRHERRARAAAARVRTAVLIEREPPLHDRASAAADHVRDLLEVCALLVAHPRAAGVLG